jgi:hypothetical protein
MRAIVDLSRFDLLKELRLALLADSDVERHLWEELNKHTTYGTNGARANFRSQHPKSAA